jgi:hypothetical protein
MAWMCSTPLILKKNKCKKVIGFYLSVINLPSCYDPININSLRLLNIVVLIPPDLHQPMNENNRQSSILARVPEPKKNQ